MAPIHIEREDPGDGARLYGDFPRAPEPLVSVTDASGRIDRWLGEPPDAAGRIPRFERTRELPWEALVDLHGLRWSAEHARPVTPAESCLVIGEEDELVPRWALDPPAPSRTRWAEGFSLRPRLAHRYLQLYSRADDALVREIARTLTRLKGVDGWRTLGVARLEDYARERLGCTRRWAQQLMRLDEALTLSAPLRAAHASGALSTAKVLALAPLARAVAHGVGDLTIPEEQLVSWIERGRTASVRKLKGAFRTEWASAEMWAEEEEEERRAAAGDGRADAEQETVTNDRDASPCRDDAADPPDGEWVQFRAPAPVAYLHELAVDLARAMAPEATRPGACVELVLAEHLAACGLPDDDADDAPDDEEKESYWRFSHDDPFEPYRQVHHLGAEAATESVALLASLLAAQVPPRAEDLDRHLCRLVRARQRRRAEMRRLLHYVRRHQLWKPLGYRSFRTYCERALGLAERTAQELVATEEALRALPAIAEAFASGAITGVQVAGLLRVARPESEGAWLARARAVTVRYLEREVAEAEHRAAATGEAALPLPLSTVPPYAEGSPVRPGAALAAVLCREGASDGVHVAGEGAEARTCSHGAERAFRVLPSLTRWMIRFWLPRDVHRLWTGVDRALARAVPDATRPWQRYAILLAGAIDEWCLQSTEARTRTEAYRFHEREGFMCAVPGCTHRASFEAHHVLPRAQGGDDAPENRTSLCPVHHRLGVHGPWQITVGGEAPDQLTWEMGIGTFQGDVRVA